MPYIDDIFKRYLTNSCTEEELSILLRYFELEDYTEKLTELVEQELLKPEQERVLPESLTHMVERNRVVLQDKISGRFGRNSNVRRFITTISIAAAILLVSSFVVYYFNFRDNIDAPALVQTDDIAPGTNRATLSLAGGQSITLSEDKEGVIIDEGTIAYTDGTDIIQTREVQYATLTTPRAGQYQITLSDGTKVWLNAESSLHYPTDFTEEKRIVEIQGEAFFDVAENKDKPFVVQSATQQVTVTGTSFNVNAYHDDKTTVTTLVTGSVRINNTDGTAFVSLKAGEQSVLEGSRIKVKTIDPTEYTAWKDGLFILKDADFATVKLQLERWYDVTFVGQSNSDAKVSAILSRNVNLSDVLKTMENHTGTKFKIEGRRIMVQ